MKIPSFILCLIFLSCGNPKTEIPQDILSETTFTNILKEVHLAEAAFELSKTKSMKNAKNALANSYQSIYKKHSIDEADFSNTLSYYALHPEKLEAIYTTVLEELSKERTTLNQ